MAEIGKVCDKLDDYKHQNDYCFGGNKKREINEKALKLMKKNKSVLIDDNE